MKIAMRLFVPLLLCVGVSAHAFAQATPAPRYVKKAIFVRIHFDSSFYNYWSPRQNVNTLVEGYFNEVRAAYLNNASLHNIDLILINDFDRRTGPMMNFVDPNHAIAEKSPGEIGGNGRLIKYMRDNLSTGQVTKRTGQTTHILGRSINWVFVHQGAGGLAGQANATPAISSSDANVFVTTDAGDFFQQGRYISTREQTRSVIIENIAHETGHLLGGTHNDALGCGAQAGFGGEIMCTGATRREFSFGTRNFPTTERVMKGALERCNNAFRSFSACDALAASQCSHMDPTQIPACYEARLLSMCSDLCSNAQTSARVLINSLPAIINGAL